MQAVPSGRGFDALRADSSVVQEAIGARRSGPCGRIGLQVAPLRAVGLRLVASEAGWPGCKASQGRGRENASGTAKRIVSQGAACGTSRTDRGRPTCITARPDASQATVGKSTGHALAPSSS